MTDPRSPFEDVPVVRITPPSDARRVQVGTLIVLATLVLLIIKPWGEPLARPSPAPTTAAIATTAAPTPRPTRTNLPDGARAYDPSLFGRFTVVPGWALWPTLYVSQFGLMGPLPIGDGSSPGVEPTPIPTATPKPTSAPASPPPGADQLIDIGAADLLMVLGLDTPAESRILDARLWRFPEGGAPVRMALVELPAPWPVPFFHVYGLPVPGNTEPDLVAFWPPATYRLDLLADPGAEVRRIGLLVRPPLGAGPSAPPVVPPETPVVDPAALRTLGPNQVALGGAPGTWGITNLEVSQACGLPELWLAEQDRPGADPCWSIIASEDVRMIGLRLGPGDRIRDLSLDQVDPLRRSVPVSDVTAAVRVAPDGALVMSVDSGRPLAEGTYRLTASLAGGEDRAWYVRVPAAGRP